MQSCRGSKHFWFRHASQNTGAHLIAPWPNRDRELMGSVHTVWMTLKTLYESNTLSACRIYTAHLPLWATVHFWSTWVMIKAQGQTLIPCTAHILGTAVAQWLRCRATNRKVAGSIPYGVIGNFHWHNPSDRTMALGSTQALTEMSTRSISWG